MFNLSQKMVFCQSRPVPPWGTQGGELFQGPGRGGMVFLGPLEMIPPIRNLDRSFLASPAQSRPGVRRVVQGVRRGGTYFGGGKGGDGVSRPPGDDSTPQEP